MKHDLIRASKRAVTVLGAVAVAAVVSSCAATSVKKTWKSPESKGPVGKIAAITVEQRIQLRKGFENRLVGQLREAGNTAITTFNLLSFDEIKADKRVAAECLRTNGAETVLILRMLDAGTRYREVQSGGDRYAEIVTGYDHMDWYGYYSVAFMDMTSTYGSLTRQIYLETMLFDLKTERRLWAGVTKTVIREGMDAVAEMDPLVAKILAGMRKDGVIK